MEIQNQCCHYTFQARPGKQLTKLIRREFGGDEAKITKFESLFDRVYTDLDTNTIIDIDKNERYVFSNSSFPDISYCYGRKLVPKPLTEVVIAECPKTFAYGQLLLFRNIVKILSERKISLEEIEKMGFERITNQKASKTFMKTIKTAKWIKENMSKTKLNQVDFEVADNIIATEKLNKNREALAEYENDLRKFIAKVSEILEW